MRVENFLSFIFQPPAKVNFFLMGKKTFVKAILLPKIFTSDKQSTAGSPENLYFIIVLAVVVFAFIKNASAAVRITKIID